MEQAARRAKMFLDRIRIAAIGEMGCAVVRPAVSGARARL
jgi:hypothetical protein